jgi:biopolymer transport protein ExbD
MKLGDYKGPKMELQISPLIDVVFLLLIYFMVTASLVKKEGDMSFRLPTHGHGDDFPIEVTLEIGGNGDVLMDGMRFGSDDVSHARLVSHLADLKQLAHSQQSDFYVSLQPHDEALHGRVVKVMDACASAGVEKLGFVSSI